MKINPKKCSFGVEEGPFLGHLISKQGIKANPLKVKAITNLKPPMTLKEIQSLNWKLAALSRFISKGANSSLPFFKALKSCTDKNTIQWTTDAEEAFQKMKEFTEILPTLTTPIKGQRAKWAIELGEDDIEFKKRKSVKWKILVDFLAKIPSVEDKDTEIKKPKAANKALMLENTDGASSFDGSGADLMLVSPEGKEYTYSLSLQMDEDIISNPLIFIWEMLCGVDGNGKISKACFGGSSYEYAYNKINVRAL
ncbi:hypothetical protein Tco_0696845 [Tanacetum coccineum]